MIDFKHLLGELVIHIGNILILFFILRTLVYKPVAKYMDARKATIEGELAKAEEAKAQLAQFEEKLAQGDEAAKKLADEALAASKQKALASAHTIVEQAKAQAADIIDAAGKEAAEERAKLIGGMQEEIGDMAVDIAGRILKREVTTADNAAIIDAFFKEVK